VDKDTDAQLINTAKDIYLDEIIKKPESRRKIIKKISLRQRIMRQKYIRAQRIIERHCEKIFASFRSK
jgi:hypothetical protein